MTELFDSLASLKSSFCVRPIVPDKCVKIGYLRLSRSTQKPLEAAYSTFFRDNFLPEVVRDIISGVAVEYVGMDNPVKFADAEVTDDRVLDCKGSRSAVYALW